MRRVIYFLSIVFFLMGGCTKISVKEESIKAPYKTFKGVVDIDITVEKQGKTGVEISKQMALMAQKQGVLQLARKWLNQSMIFKVGKKYSSDKTADINVIETNFHPIYDDLTGIYEAKFKCFVELDPVNYLSGIITGIEGGYSIATSHIAIKFFHFIPEENTYFVIAKKNEFGVKNYYQIIGVGRIYNKNKVDRISQGEILTSNRSIKSRDMVFLLKTKVIPIVEKKLESSEKNQMPIVKVHPVLEKQESGPKEMK